jgi:TM2 domain-containing membrane protein YozV
MTTDKLSFEQERELSRLAASANLQRMRGQWADAEETCRKALVIAPRDVVFRELLADTLHECGKLDAAMVEYKTAMALAPGKTSLEKKYAKLAIEIGERDRARGIAEDMIVNPRKYTARARNPVWALVSAIVVPGLGQFYNGEVVKAVIIFSTFALFLIAFRLFQPIPHGVVVPTDLLRNMDPLVQMLGVIAAMAYIYGLIDAPLMAEKSSKAGREAKKHAEPE